jgi:hypothetical protein
LTPFSLSLSDLLASGAEAITNPRSHTNPAETVGYVFFFLANVLLWRETENFELRGDLVFFSAFPPGRLLLKILSRSCVFLLLLIRR